MNIIDKNQLYSFAKKLFPIHRSLIGDGTRKTLFLIKEELTSLKIINFKSGSNVFDWVIPDEWVIKEAYILTPGKKKICDIKKNNLHVVGYSSAINKQMSLNELKRNLYSIANQPNVIPYITSYYKKNWGFCIEHNKLKKLKKGRYRAVIKSNFIKSNMSIGEVYIKGNTKKEILLSTYICHPSLANNEISGPVVTTFLTKWINSISNRKYNYRILYLPETIGSIAYLSKFHKNLKKNVIAGFNITCIGDNRDYSFLPSRAGNTLSDVVAQHVLYHFKKNYKKYSWQDRGSDERQYCSPGIDLPIATIMRTKYGKYKEYHTSDDKLGKVVTPQGLIGGFEVIKKSIEAIEKNFFPKTTVLCEPNLSKRNLYPHLSKKNDKHFGRLLTNIITWSDGNHSLIDIANKLDTPVWELYHPIKILIKNKLIK